MTCHKDSKTAEDGAPRPSPLGVAETGLCFESGTATPDWWRMEKSKLLDKKAVDVTLEDQASHNHTHPATYLEEQSKREKAMEEEMKQIEAKEVLCVCLLWIALT